jgi:hypothetical protein
MSIIRQLILYLVIASGMFFGGLLLYILVIPITLLDIINLLRGKQKSSPRGSGLWSSFKREFIRS